MYARISMALSAAAAGLRGAAFAGTFAEDTSFAMFDTRWSGGELSLRSGIEVLPIAHAAGATVTVGGEPLGTFAEEGVFEWMPMDAGVYELAHVLDGETATATITVGQSVAEFADAAPVDAALDTREVKNGRRKCDSFDEVLPFACSPTLWGASGAGASASLTVDGEAQGVFSQEGVFAWTPLLGGSYLCRLSSGSASQSVTLDVTDAEAQEIRANAGFAVEGAARPAAGTALTAAFAALPEGTEVSYVWTRADSAGVWESDAVSTAASYTPTEADYEHFLRVVASTARFGAFTNEMYFSKLPVVYITGTLPATKAQGYRDVEIAMQGNGEYAESYSGACEIKIRGNSTANYVKKPWKLKLGSKANPYGIGKKTNKHWVLLANYYDQSLVRTSLACKTADLFGALHMDAVWVDVVVNGAYHGNYQLCEHIRIASDRVDIYDWEGYAEDFGKAIFKNKKGAYGDVIAALTAAGVEYDGDVYEALFAENMSWLNTGVLKLAGGAEIDVSSVSGATGLDISGGYLFEMDDRFDEVSKFLTRCGLKVNVNTPELLHTSDAMMEAASNLWNSAEEAWRSPDGYANGVHYSDVADRDSMVAYWLTQEVMSNWDAVRHSRYAHCDIGGKLVMGPVWDFDHGIGDIWRGETYAGWQFTQVNDLQNMYRDWVDDPDFCLRAWKEYWAARDALGEFCADGGDLDIWHEYLAEAGAADYKRWIAEQNKTFAAYGGARGFEKDFEVVKRLFAKRLEWLDAQFATVETLMASVRTSASASPYTRSSALKIAVANGSTAKVDSMDLTDVAVAEGEDASLSASFAGAASVDAYTNGIMWASSSGPSFKADVPQAVFADSRACVSFVARDAAANVLARNYVLLRAGGEDVAPEVAAADGGVVGSSDGKWRTADGTASGSGRVWAETDGLASGETAEISFAFDGAGTFLWNWAADGAAAFTLCIDGEEVAAHGDGSSAWLSQYLSVEGGGSHVAVFRFTQGDGGVGGVDAVSFRKGAFFVEFEDAAAEAAFDTRDTGADNVREVASISELLPIAHSASAWGESTAASSAVYLNGVAVAEYGDDGSAVWEPDGEGVYAFVHASGDVYATATFVVASSAMTPRFASASIGGAAFDTRDTASGNVRTPSSADELLPFAYSGSAWGAASSGTAAVSLNGSAFGSYAGEGTFEWRPDAPGTYAFTHVRGGSTETAVFVISESVARWATAVTFAAAEGRGDFDTRDTGIGNARTVAAADDILPFAYSATAWGANDGGTAASLTLGGEEWKSVSGEGTVQWVPSGYGKYVFAHLSGVSALTATFEVPKAVAVAIHAGEAGAASVAERPAITGYGAGEKVVFSVKLADGCTADLATWTAASALAGKIGVRRSATLEGLAKAPFEEISAADVADGEVLLDLGVEEGRESMFLQVVIQE